MFECGGRDCTNGSKMEPKQLPIQPGRVAFQASPESSPFLSHSIGRPQGISSNEAEGGSYPRGKAIARGNPSWAQSDEMHGHSPSLAEVPISTLPPPMLKNEYQGGNGHIGSFSPELAWQSPDRELRAAKALLEVQPVSPAGREVAEPKKLEPDKKLEAQVLQHGLSLEMLKSWQIHVESQLHSIQRDTERCADRLEGMGHKHATIHVKMIDLERKIDRVSSRPPWLPETPAIADEFANKDVQDRARVGISHARAHSGDALMPSQGRFASPMQKGTGMETSGLAMGAAEARALEALEESSRNMEREMEALKAQQVATQLMCMKLVPLLEGNESSGATSRPESDNASWVRKEEGAQKTESQQQVHVKNLQQNLAVALSAEGTASVKKEFSENLSTLHEEYPSVNPSAGGDNEENDPAFHELHASVLDKAEMYEAGETIWDITLFAGLPYLGLGVSAMICTVYFFNIVMQLWFCAIIWTYMLEGPVESDFFDDLLHFRVSVAHNADYADKLQMRSMAAQICAEDEKLHLSGRHFEMYSAMAEFQEGAMPLCILTITCWIIKILGEASDAVQFLRMLWSIRRGSVTKVMTDLESTEKGQRKTVCTTISDDEQAAELLKVAVVVRLTSLTLGRSILMSLAIALPRLLLASVLGIIGILYLSITSKMEELLLNGMALAFIADIDEIIYALFVPRRAKTFIGNLEPLPVTFAPLKTHLHIPWLTSLIKLTIVMGLSLIVTLLFTDPFFQRLRQATDILCSGDTDFVVGKSKATGMLHVARTQGGGDWTTADKAVLQLARPNFIENIGWEVDQDILDFMKSNVTFAVVEPKAPSLEASRVSRAAFDFVASLSTLPVGDSVHLTCENMVAGQSLESTLMELQELLGDASIKGCEESVDTILPLCSRIDMSRLRAICPRTCGCSMVFPQHAGFFAHPIWGCPGSCLSMRIAFEGYQFVNGLRRPCEDMRPPVFFLSIPFEATGDDVETMSIFFGNYIRGLFAYLRIQPGFEEIVRLNVPLAAAVGVVPPDRVDEMISDLLTGKIGETILQGNWELLPGVPHYRGLIGCDFLTAPEFTFLLGTELCDATSYFSIRGVCPLACGCGSLEGCPMTCSSRSPPAALPCADMSDGHFPEATIATLQWIVNDSSVTSCNENQQTLLAVTSRCGQLGSKTLRQICPDTCNCQVPFNDYLGFFAGAAFGCPESCDYKQTAVLEVLYEWGQTQCADRPLASFYDDDVTAAELSKWIGGLFEWLEQLEGKRFELIQNLIFLASGSVLPSFLNYSNVEPSADYVLSGEMGTNILSNNWNLFPGLPHPRGLTGCDFLTSYELLLVLGIDLCAAGKFTSLRQLCPVSCKCSAGMLECPYACQVSR